MKKLGVLFATVIMIMLFSISVSALDAKGQCGDNAYWNFDDKSGELFIFGSGDINSYSFKASPFYLSNIKKIIIEEGITDIGSAFLGCFELESVVMADTVTNISNYAFAYCVKLSNIRLSKSLIGIGKFAFEECISLSNILFPESLKYIESYAFRGCESISEVSFSDGIIYIGEEAFSGCKSLEKIRIPKSVEKLGSSVFGGCTSLTDFFVNEQNTKYSSLDGVLFNKNKTLLISYPTGNKRTSYVVPESVTAIEPSVFLKCENLSNIVIHDEVKEISTFKGCTNLSSVKLPAGLTEIENSLFEGCTSLTKVDIPKNVTKIGSRAFFGCKKLQNLIIPENVESLGEFIFTGCLSLTDISVDEQNDVYSSLDGVLFNKNKTKLLRYPSGNTRLSYSVPENVSTIGDTAFGECTNLISIYMSENVKTIEKSAFSGCSGLKSIVIPKSITIINTESFSDCKNLESLTFGVNVRVVDDYAFNSCTSLTNVYYRGNNEQWERIIIKSNNEILSEAKIHYNYIEGHIHDYTPTITKSATCKELGVKTYTCTCGGTYTESIAKSAHWYKTEITKATLTQNGSFKKSCANCGLIESDGIYYSPKTIKLLTTKYFYDGKVKTPAVSVVDKNGTILKEDIDYIVSYGSGRKKPGKYTVKITFIGNYEGVKKLNFTITEITAIPDTESIKLKWKKVSGATGYRVYQYNSKTGKYEKLKTLTDTSYTVKKLKAGTTYKFAVKSYKKLNGKTQWSESVLKIKTATKPTAPSVKITSGKSKVTLKWSKVTGATGYEIYMKNMSNKYIKIDTTNSTSYTKNGLEAGRGYYFYVRAYKTVDGVTIYSDYKSVKGIPLFF